MDKAQRIRTSAREGLQRLRQFDYSNLSFLYIACLLSIALVYSLFRASQYFLNRQETRALQAIEQVAQQRELVGELERLVAFAQNRTAPQYPVTARLLIDSYRTLARRHAEVIPRLNFLGSRCKGRPCEELFRGQFLSLIPTTSEEAFLANRLSAREHNALLQHLFDLSVRYHLALKDTMTLSFGVIQSKNSANMTFDLIAYFSLISLLLIQAIYIFRPAIRRLNASLSTRSDFMSRISHEIRNPMNSIIGMADILKSTRLNSEQQHYIENLLRSGHALLDLLNNLIDSSALERGRLSLKPDSFDLQRTIDRALNLVAIQAHHKNINIYTRMNPLAPTRLVGDATRLEQVLVNLLNNAVKFTEQGHVCLDVDLVQDEDEAVDIRFAVSDTGIGIREDLLGKIFDSFVQADSSIQRKYGGSGLGLSIASELIRMMGGELRARSELGNGSQFDFILRFARQNTQARESSPLLALSHRKFIFMVSVAEASAYKEFFQRLAAPAAILHSSQDLRAHLGTHDTKGVHQLLIDDSVGIISMITCRNLAEENGLGEAVVALIRSGFTKENMDLLKRNGFKRFLVKPLKPWEILELPPPINDDVAQPAVSQNQAMVNKLREKNLRILLVDDSNDNLFLLKEVVNPLASVVHFAENGLEALEKFSRNKYDVVFMDIQMPVMDGYTAIRKMRDFENKSDNKMDFKIVAQMPIFAVTAHAGLVDAQKCREAGFTDRIVKPVVRSDIYLSLSKAFRIEIGEIAVEENTALPAKYLVKLMPGFIKTRNEDLQKLRMALIDQDYAAISSLGHKMKGSSASYGFLEASQLCLRLEEAAKASELAVCQTLTQELAATYAKIALKWPSDLAPRPTDP